MGSTLLKRILLNQSIQLFFEYYENIPQPTEDDSTTTTPTEDDSTKIEKPTTNPSTPTENESIIQNEIPTTNPTKPKETETIIPKETNEKSVSSNNKQKKSENLSVEDIELGKMLNQINLECDKSKYTDTISYYDGMGPALYRLCKFDSSIHVFSESLIKDPSNVEILSNKGSALGKLGYGDEAIFHLDRAIDIDPNFLPAKNNKANILASQGKHEEAIYLYTEILGKNPNYEVARNNLELVLSSLPEKPILSTSYEKNIPPNDNFINEKIQIKTNQEVKTQQEKTPDFFDQLGSVFSSFGSLLGILD